MPRKRNSFVFVQCKTWERKLASSSGNSERGASKAVNDMGPSMSKTIHDYAILFISIS